MGSVASMAYGGSEMHDGEFSIDDELVRGLVRGQFPEWSDLPLTRVESSGTVHAIYRLGQTMAVRLPRLAAFMSAVEREARILPRLGPYLPLRIPELIAVGQGTREYPSTWSVVGWIGGETADRVPFDEPMAAATRLGEFVAAMRSVRLPGETSTNRRGRPLVDSHEWTTASVAAVAAEFDPRALTAIWETALTQPVWDGSRTWIHGDLMPGNLVVENGELSAVLDFGECALGNPTLDLIAGWWVFDGESRHAFRCSANVDTPSWNRARGWALSGAVGALAYYVDTNLAFSELARRAIRNVIADGEASIET